MDLAEQIGLPPLIEGGAKLREFDLFFFTRVLREDPPELADALDPARIVLRLMLEFEEPHLDVGMLSVKLLGLLCTMRVVVQHRIDDVLLGEGMRPVSMRLT